MGETATTRSSIFKKINTALGPLSIGESAKLFKDAVDNDPGYSFQKFVDEHVLTDGDDDERKQWEAGWRRYPALLGDPLEGIVRANLLAVGSQPMQFEATRRLKQSFGLYVSAESQGAITIDIRMPY